MVDVRSEPKPRDPNYDYDPLQETQLLQGEPVLVHERRVPEPILPLGLWRQRVLALCNIGGFGASATYMAVSALLPSLSKRPTSTVSSVSGSSRYGCESSRSM